MGKLKSIKIPGQGLFLFYSEWKKFLAIRGLHGIVVIHTKTKHTLEKEPKMTGIKIVVTAALVLALGVVAPAQADEREVVTSVTVAASAGIN